MKLKLGKLLKTVVKVAAPVVITAVAGAAQQKIARTADKVLRKVR